MWQESVRWWIRWLKGIENGIDETLLWLLHCKTVWWDPAKRLWSPPWTRISEPSWPSPKNSFIKVSILARWSASWVVPNQKCTSRKIVHRKLLGLHGGSLVLGIRLDMETTSVSASRLMEGPVFLDYLTIAKRSMQIVAMIGQSCFS